jgi:hypothetical protein
LFSGGFIVIIHIWNYKAFQGPNEEEIAMADKLEKVLVEILQGTQPTGGG